MGTKDICILVFFIGFIIGWFVFEIVHAIQDDDVIRYKAKWEWDKDLGLYYCPCCNITSSRKTEFCCRCGANMGEE